MGSPCKRQYGPDDRRLPAQYYVEHILPACFHVDAANGLIKAAESKHMEEAMKDGTTLGAHIHAPTRREFIAAGAAALGSLAVSTGDAWAGTGDEIARTGESIHQEVIFKASRKRVYSALIDSAEFNKVTRLSAAVKSGVSLGNKPTTISREVGGAFTLFGGHIIGRHIELVPNERIVQAWRVVDWGPGVYSIAKFQLSDEGSDTKLLFSHTAFPDGQGQHLAEGWKTNYWEPLKKVLGSNAMAKKA